MDQHRLRTSAHCTLGFLMVAIMGLMQPGGSGTPKAIIAILSPHDGERVQGDNTQFVVRIGIVSSHLFQSPDLQIELEDSNHNTVSPLPSPFPVLSTGPDPDGWTQVFEVNLDVSRFPLGTYSLRVRLTGPGRLLVTASRQDFVIGVPLAIAEALVQRWNSLHTFADKGYTFLGGDLSNPLGSAALLQRDVVSFENVRAILDQLAGVFVDPQTGVAYKGFPDSVLAHSWRASYGDQVNDTKTALNALTWRMFPSFVGESGLSDGDYGWSDFRLAKTSTPPLAPSLDKSNGGPIKSWLDGSTRDLVSHTPVIPTDNAQLGPGYWDPGIFNVGLCIGWDLASGLWRANVVRRFHEFKLPQELDDDGPTSPIDDLRLVIAARINPGYPAQSAQKLTVTLRGVPKRSWQLTPTEWSGLDRPTNEKTGLVVIPLDAAHPVGTTQVFSIKQNLRSILLPNTKPSDLRFQAAALIGIALTDDERPPQISEIVIDPPDTYGINGHFIDRLIATNVSLIYHQSFEPVFAVISPKSLDGAANVSPESRGALDFGSQKAGSNPRGPVTRDLTITNAGSGPLFISDISPRVNIQRPVFSFEPRDCIKATISPGASCNIHVTFDPADNRAYSEEVVIWDNAEGSPHHVSLVGTGTKQFLNYDLTVDPDEQPTHYRLYSGDRRCPPLIPLTLPDGWEDWALVEGQPGSPQVLEGQVIEGHVASDDFAPFHFAQDANFFVYPDPGYRGLLAKPGNFEEGDPYEKGRIEVEWEKRHPDFPGGFPAWAWPMQGDRVHVVGSWIYDCGHNNSGPDGYRTEIHPPRLVVTYRNAALGPVGGVSGRLGSYHASSSGLTRATRADVFASSFGGKAINHLYMTHDPTEWWQPINDTDYTFTIKAPPKPAATATLTHWQCNHLVPGDCAGHDLASTDTPVSGSVPHSLPLVFEPLPGGDGYTVTIPLRTLNGQSPGPPYLVVVAASVWVGWENAPANVPADTQPKLRKYKVTVDYVSVLENLTRPLLSTGQNAWSMYAYANEWSASLFDDGRSRSPLGELLRVVGRGDQIRGTGASSSTPTAWKELFVTLVDHQPLHLGFLGASYKPDPNAPITSLSPLTGFFNGEGGTAYVDLLEGDPRLTNGQFIVKIPRVPADTSIQAKPYNDLGMPVDPQCWNRTDGCFIVSVKIRQR